MHRTAAPSAQCGMYCDMDIRNTRDAEYRSDVFSKTGLLLGHHAAKGRSIETVSGNFEIEADFFAVAFLSCRVCQKPGRSANGAPSSLS